MATVSSALALVEEHWPEAGTAPAGPRSERLSDKERTVFREIARGTSTEAIAGLLTVSPHTVRTHVKNGMRKLSARTRAHAVAIALSEGTIELEPDRPL
jgi:DNA-binding CsgD family transcriptional regulator